LHEDRILSENGINLPSDWFVTSETKQALRVFKSVLCFFQSAGRFCLGRNQIVALDMLSGAINVYYGLFDLGIACLDLVPQYKFGLHQEFVFPEASNWDHIRRSRLTPLRHNETIKELGRLAKNYPYLSRIRSNLERWIGLRELFSYGPWVQVISIGASSDDMPIPSFPSQPIFLEGDLKTERTKPQPVLPLHNEIELLVPTVDKLLDGFPSFVLSLINEKRVYTRIIVKAMVLYALIQAPFFLAPHIPLSVFEETKSRMRRFLAALGGDYFREIGSALDRQWGKPDYVKALESGSRLQADLKLERKTPHSRVCMSCGSVFPAELGQCPNCKGIEWKWGK